MTSLAEALPIEQARCRQLITTYRDLQAEMGPRVNVSFACASIEAALATADQAVMSGDVVAMIRAYETLRQCR